MDRTILDEYITDHPFVLAIVGRSTIARLRRMHIDVEDVNQNAIIVLYRRWHQYDSFRSDITTWSKWICRTCCFQAIEQKLNHLKRFSKLGSACIYKPEFTKQAEMRLDIQSTFDKMSPRAAQVLIDKYYLRLSCEEIAIKHDMCGRNYASKIVVDARERYREASR